MSFPVCSANTRSALGSAATQTLMSNTMATSSESAICCSLAAASSSFAIAKETAKERSDPMDDKASVAAAPFGIDIEKLKSQAPSHLLRQCEIKRASSEGFYIQRNGQIGPLRIRRFIFSAGGGRYANQRTISESRASIRKHRVDEYSVKEAPSSILEPEVAEFFNPKYSICFATTFGATLKTVLDFSGVKTEKKKEVAEAISDIADFFSPVSQQVKTMSGEDRQHLINGLATNKVERRQAKLLAECSDPALKRTAMYKSGHMNVALGATAAVIVAHYVLALSGANASDVTKNLTKCVDATQELLDNWNTSYFSSDPIYKELGTTAAFRFYNASLKANVYDKCLIPTKQSPSAGSPVNEAKESQYTGHKVYSGSSLKESAFYHRSRQLSPNAADSTREELSTPFASRGVAAGATGGNSVKRRKRELEGLLRVCKVRMFPTAAQKQELKRTFSAVRRAYNATVASVNAGSKPNFYERRKEYADSEKPEWAKGVSTRIIAGGVEAAVNAYKTNFAKMKVNSSHTHFQVRFMSHKKTKTEVVRIEAKSASASSPLLKIAPVPYTNSKNRAECLAFFGNNLKSVGGIRLQDTDKVIQKMLAESKGPKETCRIHYDKRTEAFHFLYTYEIPRLEDPDPEFEAKRVVATDPGARRFQTYYSPTSGEYGVLLTKQKDQLEERCKQLDERASWLAKRANCYSSDEHRARRTRRQRHNTFRNRRRKLAKERVRLHEWMTRAHYDSANFLLQKYDVVVSPKLETAAMVPKDGRVFGCKTARAMLTWSHGLFAQRLASASARYAGRCVITDSGEPGTSKTCTHCGHWNASLGGSSIYHCTECGISVDRDVAGARNNFLAAIGAAMGVGWDGNSD